MASAIQIVDDASALAELAEDWRALAVDASTAFVTPEWFFSWMTVYGDDATPLVAVRHAADGSLAGVMPLIATGHGRRRTVRFAGAALGDRFFPLDAESPADLAVGTLHAIRARGEAGALILDNVEEDTAWVQAVERESEVTTHLEPREEVLPEVEIADLSWDEYLAGRSRNLRSQLGRKRRRLEREHAVVFRRADRDSLDADLDAFVSLHQGRWEGRGGSAALDPESIRFHRELAGSLLDRGWLRLWIVEIDGRPAAAWYGWSVGERYSYYLAGFDEAYADYSLGTILLAHTIEQSIAEGAAVYEMLRGSEPFKRRFTTGERRVTRLMLTSRFHPARLGAIGPAAARRALNRLGPSTAARVKHPLRALTARAPATGAR